MTKARQALSQMGRETQEAPEAIARLLDREGSTLQALGRRCRVKPPTLVATCARGTSDNAANFLKYSLGILTGTPVASIGPSVASVYEAPLRLEGAVYVTISQSGRSPDLVAAQAAAKASGALTVAFVNVTDNPVAASADIVIPLHAGEERSTAATKSFMAELTAAAAFAAAWGGNEALLAALQTLPAALAEGLAADWSAADAVLAASPCIFTLGRGPAFALAQEARLKFKETMAIGAEAFSTVDVETGPVRILGGKVPAIAFVPDDAAARYNRSGLDKIARAGGALLSVGTLADLPGTRLPAAATGHGMADIIAMAAPLFALVERQTRARGLDPDRPQYFGHTSERAAG